jgi:hypothetical protein
MELYSGAKMVNEKYLKTKNVRSKNREFTVLIFRRTKRYQSIYNLKIDTIEMYDAPFDRSFFFSYKTIYDM